MRQSTGYTPKLNDTDLGPENGLPSPTTDVAYTLGGPSKTGKFEMWIEFMFVSRVSLSHVTLHYYCTGTPPQLQLVDASGMATSTMTPSCGDATHRQSLTFSIIQLVIVLSVKRNGGYFYLTEVQFFNEPTPGNFSKHYDIYSTERITSYSSNCWNMCWSDSLFSVIIIILILIVVLHNWKKSNT